MSEHPRSDTTNGVGSSGMFELECVVTPGVFSHERLIAFTDASGETQSALVDERLIRGGRLVVRGVASHGNVVIVALPSDGTRVRVPAESVQAV